MSLEERSIAAARKHLMACKAFELANAWNEASHLRGGNSHVVFEEQHRRDILAYTMVHSANIHGCSIFGGFVRAHYSGKPWNDLDIMVPDGEPEDKIWTAMIKMVMFVLPISKFHIQERDLHKSGGYSKQYVISITNLENVAFKVDLVRNPHIPLLHSLLPVTMGSCLRIQNGCVAVRNIPRIGRLLSSWTADEIVEMLRNGEDMKLCMHQNQIHNSIRKKYREYYWLRITKMEAMWKLHPSCEKEPPKMTTTELKTIMDLNRMSINDALA